MSRRLACWIGWLLACSPLLGAAADESRDWTVLLPERANAEAGVELTHAGDGVIVAGGANPDTVTYEADFRTDKTRITAVRVELLTHPSLPHGGPGRAEDGGFVLTELQLFQSRGLADSPFHPVELRSAVADHEHISGGSNHPAAQVIDGILEPANGWSGEGRRFHEPRTLVVVPRANVGLAGGCVLRVRLVFASRWPQHAAGSFRVSVTEYHDAGRMLPTRRAPADADVHAATARGIAWLLARQLPDGSWGGPDGRFYYGMTALAVYTLLQCGLPADHPAIQAGVSYIDHRPMTRTYDVACVLMAYRALGPTRPKARVAELTRFLIEHMGNGERSGTASWGYPFGLEPGSRENLYDLSNTQYALLGLRAGAGCGERVPATVWERAARELLEEQHEYGSFRYRPDRAPSASMTVAGIGALLICAEQLESNRNALKRRIDDAVAKAEQWLQNNWSVEENLFLPRVKDGDSARWYYYYMYGLERVGSLSNRQMVAGHDWHSEGAHALLRRQNGDGSWSSIYGEGDANTCFALMFLMRGSRSTGADERPRAQLDAAAGAFSIGNDPQHPLTAWVAELGAPVKERLNAGQRIAAVDWLVNGEPVGSTPPRAENPHLDRFVMQHEPRENGTHELAAVMRFTDAGGEPAGEERSAPARIEVDSVLEPRQREAIHDNEHNAAGPLAVEAQASSAHADHPATYAVDLRMSTGWVSGAGDARPSILLRFQRPVKAAALKLTAAHPYLGAEDQFARPREIEVQWNGGPAARRFLIDSVRLKQRFPMAAMTVRSLRITVLSTYPGRDGNGPTGFQEIELLTSDLPELGIDAFAESVTLVAPGPEQDGRWRTTTRDPGAQWTLPDFDDGSWPEGEAPFGSATTKPVPRTAWDGPDLWLRRTLTLNGEARGRVLVELLSDDQAEVYVNGTLIARNTEFSGGLYRTHVAAIPARVLLHPGSNLIAVHCRNTGGVAAVDVAIRLLR